MNTGVRYQASSRGSSYFVSRIERHVDAAGRHTGAIRTVSEHKDASSAERAARVREAQEVAKAERSSGMTREF
jgi:hypothetical protein